MKSSRTLVSSSRSHTSHAVSSPAIQTIGTIESPQMEWDQYFVPTSFSAPAAEIAAAAGTLQSATEVKTIFIDLNCLISLLPSQPHQPATILAWLLVGGGQINSSATGAMRCNAL